MATPAQVAEAALFAECIHTTLHAAARPADTAVLLAEQLSMVEGRAHLDVVSAAYRRHYGMDVVCGIEAAVAPADVAAALQVLVASGSLPPARPAAGALVQALTSTKVRPPHRALLFTRLLKEHIQTARDWAGVAGVCREHYSRGADGGGGGEPPLEVLMRRALPLPALRDCEAVLAEVGVDFAAATALTVAKAVRGVVADGGGAGAALLDLAGDLASAEQWKATGCAYRKAYHKGLLEDVEAAASVPLAVLWAFGRRCVESGAAPLARVYAGVVWRAYQEGCAAAGRESAETVLDDVLAAVPDADTWDAVRASFAAAYGEALDAAASRMYADARGAARCNAQLLSKGFAPLSFPPAASPPPPPQESPTRPAALQLTLEPAAQHRLRFMCVGRTADAADAARRACGAHSPGTDGSGSGESCGLSPAVSEPAAGARTAAPPAPPGLACLVAAHRAGDTGLALLLAAAPRAGSPRAPQPPRRAGSPMRRFRRAGGWDSRPHAPEALNVTAGVCPPPAAQLPFQRCAATVSVRPLGGAAAAAKLQAAQEHYSAQLAGLDRERQRAGAPSPVLSIDASSTEPRASPTPDGDAAVIRRYHAQAGGDGDSSDAASPGIPTAIPPPSLLRPSVPAAAARFGATPGRAVRQRVPEAAPGSAGSALQPQAHEVNFCTPLTVGTAHRAARPATTPQQAALPRVDATSWSTYSMPAATAAPRRDVATLPPLDAVLVRRANAAARHHAAKLRELGRAGVARRAQLRRVFDAHHSASMQQPIPP
eukprot:TRINITY_DN5099_c0_g4_i1.p1 TRINITY_DN5099_c0_g4~~TRINITY_DN5099_c0_g4_i1.p1  ORF type:complete len:771 (+),score=243.39 TRINITY_DN5099_c0_g4_i1:63-2375(+)